jgi:hypothetical protein
VLDLQTVNFFQGIGTLEITAVDACPWSSTCTTPFTSGCNDCNNDGDRTDIGVCAVDGETACTIAGDCTSGACNANANFADDRDCNNDGIHDLIVRASSQDEPMGELVSLNRTTDPSGDRYKGSLPISSTADIPGTLFIQRLGADNPFVTVSYDDRDDCTGAACPSNVDPSVHGRVEVGTTVFLDPASVVITAALLDDNDITAGDGDQWADSDETVKMRVELSSKIGVDLHNVILRMVSTDDDIDCVTDPTILFGTLPARQTVLSPLNDTFVFHVASAVNRTDAFADISGSFNVTMTADEADGFSTPQVVVLDLDLDASGGGNPTTFIETFDSGFGTFTTMHIDQNLNADGVEPLELGVQRSDGYRCQYQDPDNPFSISYGTDDALDCFPNPNGTPDVFDWNTTTDRAFGGTGSIHWGIDLGASLGYTSRFAQLEAIRLNAPVSLGYRNVCSQTRTTLCTIDANCPGGQFCDVTRPSLRMKHQVSLMDSRTINSAPGKNADRGVVSLQVADSGGTGVGPWIKLEPFENVYDQQANDNYFNCMFDPIDDGNDEDSLFPSGDPAEIYGPSSTCTPAFSWAFIGETFNPFAVGNIGQASDGPGLAGTVGNGTWIQSSFNLERFRGRSVRMRTLVAGVKVGGNTTYEQAFQSNPDPGDDGWWVDNVEFTDAIDSAAVVSADTNNPNLADCPNTCGSVVANLDTEPGGNPPIPSPGNTVTLNAAGTTNDACINGTLLYQFSKNGTVVQSFTTDTTYTDAPAATALYEVEVKCSADPAGSPGPCTDTDDLTVVVNCPGDYDMQIRADAGGAFDLFDGTSPLGPIHFDWVRGDFTLSSGIPAGSYATLEANTVSSGNTFPASGGNPASNTGFWYLAKKGGALCTNFCNCAEWGETEPPSLTPDRSVLGDP